MNLELYSGFENAILTDGEPDRVYNASDVNEHLKGLVSDYGIYATIGNACQVVASDGLSLIVRNGRGKVNNHWFKIESDAEITLETPDVILNRIDSIVIRRSSTDRNVVLTVKTGTLATNPVAPTIERTDDIQEICLAQVRVNANATSITSANITDTRSSNELCGWIVGLINQMDTSTLFNQYEAAQNDFINNQTNEFNNWFNSVQDEVAATSLYREYQAVYSTTVENEQTITIPSTINYVHNGLDVLNVFINGMRLLKEVEYTINSDGTAIILNLTLDVVGTDIEFVNKKSVSGSAAEDVIVQVEALQEDVNNLSNNTYLGTGENDNIKLSNIVQNFLNGTGDYSGVASNASMKINVSGTLTIDTLIDDQMMFDFHGSTETNRRVTIDFGNATIPQIPYSSTTVINTLVVFGCENNVHIENANIRFTGINATNIYCFHGGRVSNCKVNIYSLEATSIYGYWGSSPSVITEQLQSGLIENSRIYLNGSSTSSKYCVYGQGNSTLPLRILNNDLNKDVNVNYAFISGNSIGGSLTEGSVCATNMNWVMQ